MSIEKLLIMGSILLFVSVGASKLSSKLGIPILLFFLFIGIFVGQYKPELVASNGANIARKLGIITLILVLFSGGLETEFHHIRPILWSGIMLSTIGALLTSLIVGVFLRWSSVPLNLIEGLLVGTIVASTDAAAVFSILRARNIQLRANLGHLLELESGSNDVMVYFLMNFFLKILEAPGTRLIYVIPMFFQDMIIGALGGIIIGYTMVYIINSINLSYPGLYPVLVLSMLFMAYSFTEKLHGSGFLAVYIVGMILGNHDLMHKKSLIQFYKGIGWLMQIVMFIALGLLAKTTILKEVAPWGLQLCFVLILIARPISVFIALLFSRLRFKYKFFVSWVGLRGAVPIVFATYLVQLKNAPILFHLIFFVVIVSVLLQGTTLYPLAKWLKLENKLVIARKEKQMQQRVEAVKKLLIQLEVPSNSPAVNQPIVQLGIPESVFIAIIHRDKQYLQPRGDTQIVAGDRLMVMYNTKKDLKDLKSTLGIRV